MHYGFRITLLMALLTLDPTGQLANATAGEPPSVTSISTGIAAETVEQSQQSDDTSDQINQQSADDKANERSAGTTAAKPIEPSKIPKPLTNYLGREIARTMSFHGANWLTREERESEERCSLMLANLGLKRNMTVCDLGCGNGFHTLQIAKLIGDRGQVLGVDVQPEMLELLRTRVEKQGIENVVPILSSYHNPRLPRNSVDLILMVDVYHELSHPVQMLDAMKASLRTNGVIVLVEFRAEDDSVPIKRLHKMSKDQINKEMQANGLKLVREFDGLPWQHMMFFGAQ